MLRVAIMISSALWLYALDHGGGVTRAMSWNRFRTILKPNSSVFVRKGTHAQKLNSSVLKQNAGRASGPLAGRMNVIGKRGPEHFFVT